MRTVVNILHQIFQSAISVFFSFAGICLLTTWGNSNFLKELTKGVGIIAIIIIIPIAIIVGINIFRHYNGTPALPINIPGIWGRIVGWVGHNSVTAFVTVIIFSWIVCKINPDIWPEAKIAWEILWHKIILPISACALLITALVAWLRHRLHAPNRRHHR